jgi:hypothetical protein
MGQGFCLGVFRAEHRIPGQSRARVLKFRIPGRSQAKQGGEPGPFPVVWGHSRAMLRLKIYAGGSRIAAL